MSLLLALAGSVTPSPGVSYLGGSLKPRKRREPWRQALDDLLAKVDESPPFVEPVQVDKPQAPRLTNSQKSYINQVFADIVAAKTKRELAAKMAEAAREERAAKEAMQALEIAIAHELEAKQRMIDLDIVFVASVLAM